MTTKRKLLLAALAVVVATMGPVRTAAASTTTLARTPAVQAIQLHLIAGQPALTVVTDGEIIDVDELEALELLAQLDLLAMLEQMRADTLAELGVVGLPEELTAMIDEMLGTDLGAGATNVDLLDALLGLAGDVGGGGSGNPAEGLMDGGATVLVIAIVAVAIVGFGVIIADGVSRIDSGDTSPGGGAPGAPGAPGDAGVEPGGTDAGGDDAETPDSLRQDAAELDEAADHAEAEATKAEEAGDDKAAEEWRGTAQTLRDKAAEQRAKADELERQAGTDSSDPEMGNPDPFAFRAYLLALNPALEGTQLDQLGNFLAYAAAHAEGERPLHSNPVPIDDGSGGEVDVDVTTIGCVGPGCGVVDPTEDTRRPTITAEMVEKLLTYGAPGGPAVSYPPLDGEEPAEEEVLEPTGPGAGCEVC